MARLRAALDEFWKSISWLERAPKVLEFVAKLAPFVLIALGIGVIQAAKSGVEWASQINPVVLHLLVVACAMYLTWHFAIAWHKTSGPNIWIGPPEVDPHYQCFDVPVANRGSGTVTAKAFVQELCDGNDKRIPRIDEHIEVHFRGKCIGENAELHEGKPMRVAVVKALACEAYVMPVLWPPVERPLSGPVPLRPEPLLPCMPPALADQEEVRFTLRIDFFDEARKRLKTRCQRYSLTPDPKSRMCYRLRPIR